MTMGKGTMTWGSEELVDQLHCAEQLISEGKIILGNRLLVIFTKE
jgi:hypothetical protein